MQINEEGVSPVVGVMLMLVVTIIIAAVVSAFASGMADTDNAAPIASIDVRVNSAADDGNGGVTTRMIFEHLGGDSISTKDLKITTIYQDPGSYYSDYYDKYMKYSVIRHEQTKDDPKVILDKDSSAKARVPVLKTPSVGEPGDNDAADFGNFIWNPGQIMSTVNTKGTYKLLGFGLQDSYGDVWWDYDDEDYERFTRGSMVKVKIVHVPSGKLIFDKEVVVE